MKMIKKIFVPAIVGLTVASSAAALAVGLTANSLITKEQREIFNIQGDTLVGFNSNLDQNKLKNYCHDNQLVLPKVKTIGAHAFENFSTPFAKEIIISAETQVIEDYAFFGAEATEIQWEDLETSQLKKIGNSSFAMSKLIQVALPASLFASEEAESIGNRCFFGCSELRIIDLSAGGDLFGESSTFLGNLARAKDPFLGLHISDSQTETPDSYIVFNSAMVPPTSSETMLRYLYLSLAKATIFKTNFDQLNWGIAYKDEEAGTTIVKQDPFKFVPESMMVYEEDSQSGEKLFKGLRKNTPVDSGSNPIKMSILLSPDCDGISPDCTYFKTPYDPTGAKIGGLDTCIAIVANSDENKEIKIPANLYAKEETEEAESSLEFLMFNKVNSIGNNAFRNCGALYGLVATECGNIGQYAFENCEKLEGFVIQNTAEGADVLTTNIATGAFKNAFNYEDESQKSMFVAQKAGEINNDAFNSCKELELVFLPGLNYIGNNTFYGCEKLESLKNTGSFASYTNLNHIGDNAFLNCSSLEFDDFANYTALTEIGTNALSGINLGSDVEFTISGNMTIGQGAFYEIESFSKITINKDIAKAIGSYAFASCPNIVTIDLSTWTNATAGASVVPTALKDCTNIFNDCGYGEAEGKVIIFNKDIDDDQYEDLQNWMKLQLGDGYYNYEWEESE